MQNFFRYLRKGEFRIPLCVSCRKVVWPPSPYCPDCYSKTRLKKFIRTGRLLEFTVSCIGNNRAVYGIVDLSGIRLFGCIKGQSLYIGMEIRMSSCGLSSGDTVFYDFEPIK